jgi:two-component sensor histidine kinase
MTLTDHLIPDPRVASVFISEALASRPMHAGDPADEKQAILALAVAMADAPADILPKFVELAMTLTGSVSAGLSLYEPEPAPGVFRWRHLCGLLAPFENATTPRHDSPCGITLDGNRPTLSSHPERVYPWIVEAGIVVPEVLLVPLYIGSEEPLGTLWIVSDREGHFHQGHADTATELARFAGIALKMTREEERLRAALDEQELLAKEMSHRLKNLFAMTDGMIRGSARSSETVDDMASALSGRLHALADAHALVERKVSALDQERFADLAGLIATVMRVHDPEAEGASRVAIAGPAVECGAHATNSVALMIHELATNAAKYGALSTRRGRVDIAWRRDGEEIVLDWRESGGPSVTPEPLPGGFGSTLVARTVERQFSGAVTYDWAPGGLALTLRFAAVALTR